MKKIVLVLAGGKGKRLWPVSRVNFPKFFLKVTGDISLLQDAVLRGVDVAGVKNVFILGNENYKYQIKDHLIEKIKKFSIYNVVPEPMGKNTAPAVAFGVRYFLSKELDPIVFIFPADQLILDKNEFIKCMRTAEKEAEKGYIITIGMKPFYPATGYGYIKAKVTRPKAKKYYEVERFVEKPDLKTAKKYLKSGNYYWNGGIFIGKASVIWKEIERHSPNIVKLLKKWDKKDFSLLKNIYRKLPDISFDYAVMEKTKIAKVVPYKGKWNDLGDWNAIYDVLPKDKSGNVYKGNILSLDSKNNLVFSNSKRVISLLGISNSRIIDTEDALLILNPDKSQDVKKVVKSLSGNEVVENHRTVIRPWGKYTVLEHRDNYKVKIIEVNPNSSLSLQKHLIYRNI